MVAAIELIHVAVAVGIPLGRVVGIAVAHVSQEAAIVSCRHAGAHLDKILGIGRADVASDRRPLVLNKQAEDRVVLAAVGAERRVPAQILMAVVLAEALRTPPRAIPGTVRRDTIIGDRHRR